MSAFLKELEALNAPVAEIPDLEDYNFDNNVKSKSKPADDSDAEVDHDEVVLQRRRLTGAVELNDPRYKGVKVSRSEMFGDSSEMHGLQAKKGGKKRAADSDEEDDDNEDDEDEDEEESDDDDIRLEELNGDDDDEDDDGSEEDEDEDDDDEEEEEGSGDEEAEEEEKGGKISMKELMKPIAEDEERKKGESVRKQMDMCEQILLLNIKSHGAMRAFNQLPRGDTARALVAGADEKTKALINEAHSNALQLVSVLLEAERVLLGGSSQTEGLLKEGKKGTKKAASADSDDEEIESSEDEDEEEKGGKKKDGKKSKKVVDEDEEMEDDDDDGSIPDYNVSGTDDSEDEEGDEKVEGGQKKSKKVDLRGLRKACIASECRFEQFRSSTLQKWDGRTRLAAVGGAAAAVKQKKGDFSAFEGDVLAQIDKILSDKRRLIARTQSKRSDHERIGGVPESTHDVEIFDDDDFYQVLLRDLIERKQAVDTNDPIAMSRQWLEIEKLRQKRKKRNVDTRATKGRKLRYTVIPKLVNFFSAVPEGVSWTHEMRNELFKSLFK